MANSWRVARDWPLNTDPKEPCPNFSTMFNWFIIILS